MIKKVIILLLAVVPMQLFCTALSKEDSLLVLYGKAKEDTVKFDLAAKLYYQYIRSNDFTKAEQYLDSCRKLSVQLNDDRFKGAYLQYKGNYFYRSNHFDSAIVYDNKAIELAEPLKRYVVLIRCNVNLGNIYNQWGDYSKAIRYFQKAEQYSHTAHDTSGILTTALNLGNVFWYINDLKLAKASFLKPIRIAKGDSRYNNELANAYNNLGTVYLNEEPKKFDSAMMCYTTYLKLGQEMGSNDHIASAYFNIGEVQRIKKELKQAEESYTTSKKIYEEIEDTLGIMKVLLGLGDLAVLQHKQQEAIADLKQGLQYSKTYKMTSFTCDFLKSLSNAYYESGNYKEAIDYYREGTYLSDSILNADNSKLLYDMQVKYETTEKEKQNALLEAENTISHETIRQQQLITYFIIGGLLLALLSAFFIFRGLVQQRKANVIISEQKQEVQHQKEIIEEKQKEILDSIHYAKRIQDGLLEHKDQLAANVNDSFIFFRPKDIVSGDFYWATQREHLFYLAVCDSTGHGVPGAFMSLLNMGFISEAINEKNILKPHDIFNYVRERLIHSISKEGQKDGFDGILICIDQRTKEITYAAANNAPLLVADGTFTEQKKNHMPVGKGEKTDSFDLFTLNYQAGNRLYLYTDGYADQFGGPKAKKFKYRQLNEFLLSGASLPMEQQASRLKEKFEEWKGSLEQIDDVCIIGIAL